MATITIIKRVIDGLVLRSRNPSPRRHLFGRCRCVVMQTKGGKKGTRADGLGGASRKLIFMRHAGVMRRAEGRRQEPDLMRSEVTRNRIPAEQIIDNDPTISLQSPWLRTFFCVAFFHFLLDVS